MSRIVALGLVLAVACPLQAGWREPEGLGWLVGQAKKIAVYEVEAVRGKKRVITFKKVSDVRGSLSQSFHLYVPAEDESHHRAPPGQEASEWLLLWAKPGRRVVSLNHDLLYVGGYWMQVWPVREGGVPYYRLTEWHALFGFTFAGTPEELVKASRDILAGKEVVVPVFAHTPFVHAMVMKHWREEYDELPMARLRAGPKIKEIPRQLKDVFNRDNPEWRLLVASGTGRIDQLPGLLEQLKDGTPAVRMKAAREVGGVGPEARKTIPELVRLLEDDSPLVRVTAAGAVLQVDGKHAAARAILRKGLRDKEPAVRRSVARWLWLLDREVEGTIPDLVALQKDGDAAVKQAATEALKSFLTAYDLKRLTRQDLRAGAASPDPECARLADAELARPPARPGAGSP